MKGPVKSRKGVGPAAAASSNASGAPKLAKMTPTNKPVTKRKGGLYSCPSNDALAMGLLYAALSALVLVLTKVVVVEFPRPVTIVTLETFAVIVIILVQHLAFGPTVGPFRWDQAAYWQYCAFLDGIARVSWLIMLFDARFPAVCAFRAAGVLGFGFIRRDSSWSIERFVLATPVAVSVLVFALQDIHVSGLGASLPLLGVECVSVASTWLHLREITVAHGGGTSWALGTAGDAGATTDFYTSVGSLPLLVCLFWWFGENIGVGHVHRGGMWSALLELGSWLKLLLALICLCEFARRAVAHKLLAVASAKFLVCVDLLTMLALLFVGGGAFPFNSETASVWSIFLLAVGFFFSVLFVGADGLKRRKNHGQ